MRRLFCHVLALCWTLGVAAPAMAHEAAVQPTVRILSDDFVLPAKFQALQPLAAAAGVDLEWVNVDATDSAPSAWLESADLLVLDVPRPSDRARVERALADGSAPSAVPRITVGGGRPAWQGLDAAAAARLAAYYAAGGEQNYRAFFELVRRWQAGDSLAEVPPPPSPSATGFYHPQAPRVFDRMEAYLDWGASRWGAHAGRVALTIHRGMVSDLQTQLIDELVERIEAAGMMPIVFWFDPQSDTGLRDILAPAKADVLVNLTHMQNGTARRDEFRELDIPVIQTLGFREGGTRDWQRAQTGIPVRTAAVMLNGPESWGMSDPLVISAVEQGTEVPLPAQVEALVGKLHRLVALRQRPAADKRLALLFWNYPAGEKDLAASGLNVPASIEEITTRLATAGYRVAPVDEQAMIEAGQAMLSGLYRTTPLKALLARDLAVAFPVERYERWLATLPAHKRQALDYWGDPRKHWAVEEVDGVASFILPRLALGHLIVMPQMPRAGEMGAHYHDTSVPPDPLYLAAYLYLRESFGADAIIHLGTHGTQEWLPGKSRGLAADDDPFLAVGDVPVFYPYIQDNVGEAMQAKRRGRAVTISHQTPSFAPSGLYDELRDIHALIHEYEQLDEGAVRDATVQRIQDAVIAANLHDDLGWKADDVRHSFEAFLPLLHDHLHELARQAMPLGLHTFGTPAPPEHRLMTVMQQLGKPFYEALGVDVEELFADEVAQLERSVPYTTLKRYLRDGEARTEMAPALAASLTRADEFDRKLADPGEMEALLAGLEGRFVRPGAGGDPVRNPGVASGRNLYAFEADKIPTQAAFDAGRTALDQVVEGFRQSHDGRFPRKLAFSLWSSEAIRHLGVTEAQILHALGLQPVWDDGGRLQRLEIIPQRQLEHPRIDVVIQVTSVYRDQFDGFMRLLADAIARLAALDETDNVVARHSARLAAELVAQGVPSEEAHQQAALRIFSNAPGRYGSGLPELTLQSTQWQEDGDLAELYLASTQYAYGGDAWGMASSVTNLFAEQLKGTEAAIMSRSSNLHGVLSTDHPFEFLGGLSLAVRHLTGSSPELYISDLRQGEPTTPTLARFLADELRVRYLNPHWIRGMQAEGYAGTLEMLKTVNNLFGWQVTDPGSVRGDQWQAMADTYVADTRELGMADYFETNNPTAQAQLIERMVEAIRKGYWDAPDETRRALAERWQTLTKEHGAASGAPETQAFIEQMAAGFGLSGSQAPPDAPSSAPSSPVSTGEAVSVQGQVLEESSTAEAMPERRWYWPFALGVMLMLVIGGAVWQQHDNGKRNVRESKQ